MNLDADAIHEQVRARFAAVAMEPGAEKRFEVGYASAVKLGYDERTLDALPACAVESFAGVGDPLSLGPIARGMTVLDLGCGSGVDTLIAAERVRPGGRVIGVDMTEAMLDRARRACAGRGCDNVEIRQGLVDRLDVGDESVDLVISNGVINLCPDKERVLREVHRVLRPGGALQVADMSLVEGVEAGLLERVGEWSD